MESFGTGNEHTLKYTSASGGMAFLLWSGLTGAALTLTALGLATLLDNDTIYEWVFHYAAAPSVTLVALGFWGQQRTIRVRSGQLSVARFALVPFLRRRFTPGSGCVVRFLGPEKVIGEEEDRRAPFSVTLHAVEGSIVAAEKRGAEQELRAIAELLAKIYRCPLRVARGKIEQEVAPNELRFPYATRLARNPVLVGKAPGPRPAGLAETTSAGGALFEWRAWSVQFLAGLAFQLVAIYIAWDHGLESAAARHPLLVKSFLGALLGLELLLIFGLHWRLELTPDELRRTTLLFGLPVRAPEVLERGRITSVHGDRGSVFALAEGARVKLRFWGTRRATAADWIAWELRRRIAEKAPGG